MSEGIRQKLSTTQADGRFEAHDRMRPAEVVTLDLRFNFLRYFRLLADHFIDNMPPGEPIWTVDDYATDADNDWDDPAVEAPQRIARGLARFSASTSALATQRENRRPP